MSWNSLSDGHSVVGRYIEPLRISSKDPIEACIQLRSQVSDDDIHVES